MQRRTSGSEVFTSSFSLVSPVQSTLHFTRHSVVRCYNVATPVLPNAMHNTAGAYSASDVVRRRVRNARIRRGFRRSSRLQCAALADCSIATFKGELYDGHGDHRQAA